MSIILVVSTLYVILLPSLRDTAVGIIFPSSRFKNNVEPKSLWRKSLTNMNCSVKSLSVLSLFLKFSIMSQLTNLSVFHNPALYDINERRVYRNEFCV